MGKTILVVDDAASVRIMVKSSLEQEGFGIVEASTGLEALQKLQEHEIALVITDVNMPQMDGLQLLTKIREMEDFRLLPVLMLTTESGAMKDAAKRAGATGWINKPFDESKLIKSIKRVLR